jgi:CRISPR/Cas system endoribonuclease Cas6 (RAMP superfamily)
MRNKRPAGFTGWVTRELKDKENPWNKTTHMLAQYAEYANIGGNKTAAYGQTKLLLRSSSTEADKEKRRFE